MTRKQELWTALFVRWAVVSALCLFVSWLYNNENEFWHMHVMWVSRTAMVMFWIVQLIHIVFLGMLAFLVIDSKHRK